MVYSCVAIGCTSRKTKLAESLSFYRIPSDPERRTKWVAAIKRVGWTPSKNDRLCSKHFVSGRKDDNPLSPDYVPSIFSFTVSPAKKKKRLELDAFQRRESSKRSRLEQQEKREAASSLVELSKILGSQPETPTPTEDTIQSNTASVEVQTDLSLSDILSLECEIQNLRDEVLSLKDKVMSASVSAETLQKDDEKVKFYTGLPSFIVLVSFFDFIKEYIPSTSLSKLDPFNQFILTLMKLRLNLKSQDLGYRFCVSQSTISRTFNRIIDILNTRLVPTMIIWPEREQLLESMPMCFRSTFPKCVAIIDAFEVFIERPSDLKARAQTWSTYKSHNTLKYLISITPQGTISFISKGWGGRVSDKHLTNSCGIFKKLLPGDVVLADRGFDMPESVGLYCAELKIPSFTKGKLQLSAVDVEQSRKVSNVRIHVERVIGETRQKYTILEGTVPITLLKLDSFSGLTLFDKVVRVCCALVNASESVVPTA